MVNLRRGSASEDLARHASIDRADSTYLAQLSSQARSTSSASRDDGADDADDAEDGIAPRKDHSLADYDQPTKFGKVVRHGFL